MWRAASKIHLHHAIEPHVGSEVPYSSEPMPQHPHNVSPCTEILPRSNNGTRRKAMPRREPHSPRFVHTAIESCLLATCDSQVWRISLEQVVSLCCDSSHCWFETAMRDLSLFWSFVGGILLGTDTGVRVFFSPSTGGLKWTRLGTTTVDLSRGG